MMARFCLLHTTLTRRWFSKEARTTNLTLQSLKREQSTGERINPIAARNSKHVEL
jgi:hypothetical protein